VLLALLLVTTVLVLPSMLLVPISPLRVLTLGWNLMVLVLMLG
jgi:hypothetical protein